MTAASAGHDHDLRVLYPKFNLRGDILSLFLFLVSGTGCAEALRHGNRSGVMIASTLGLDLFPGRCSQSGGR
jgi:hypothetical protein